MDEPPTIVMLKLGSQHYDEHAKKIFTVVGVDGDMVNLKNRESISQRSYSITVPIDDVNVINGRPLKEPEDKITGLNEQEITLIMRALTDSMNSLPVKTVKDYIDMSELYFRLNKQEHLK